jgi:acyl phosphate:glycerol-3-phosphate acyltransferase
MDLLVPGAVFLGAYLVGAIPFGWLIARAKGIDIFTHGSGNIGATNVGRVLGRKLGLLVFVLDFAKGAVPVAAALEIEQTWPQEAFPAGLLPVLAGLGTFVGHLFPVYLRFRGGKGVATGAGVALVLVPIPALAALLAWIVVLAASRFVSLASVSAVLVLGAVQWFQSDGDHADPRSLFCLLAGLLVIARHRANLVRLAHGNENRLQETPAMTQLAKTMHVLALGLWFGMSVFFSFVATPSLFDTLEKLSERPAEQRREWLPLPPEFAKVDTEVNGPKEQGSRIAGSLVGPMFPWYFLLQDMCGIIALATAFSWVKHGKVHRWRVGLVLVAVVLALAGWPVEQRVSKLRTPRNQAVDAYLRAGSDASPSAMREARSDFGRWHVYSLMLNFATILAVAGAMALAGNLPQRPSSRAT